MDPIDFWSIRGPRSPLLRWFPTAFWWSPRVLLLWITRAMWPGGARGGTCFTSKTQLISPSGIPLGASTSNCSWWTRLSPWSFLPLSRPRLRPPPPPSQPHSPTSKASMLLASVFLQAQPLALSSKQTHSPIPAPTPFSSPTSGMSSWIAILRLVLEVQSTDINCSRWKPTSAPGGPTTLEAPVTLLILPATPSTPALESAQPVLPLAMRFRPVGSVAALPPFSTAEPAPLRLVLSASLTNAPLLTPTAHAPPANLRLNRFNQDLASLRTVPQARLLTQPPEIASRSTTAPRESSRSMASATDYPTSVLPWTVSYNVMAVRTTSRCKVETASPARDPTPTSPAQPAPTGFLSATVEDAPRSTLSAWPMTQPTGSASFASRGRTQSMESAVPRARRWLAARASSWEGL